MKRLILCWDPAFSNPFMPVCDLIASARGSIIRKKVNGERGQRCLVLLVTMKGLDSTPLARTFADGVVYRALIAEKMLS